MKTNEFKAIYCVDCAYRKKGSICSKAGRKCSDLDHCPENYDWADYIKGLKKLSASVGMSFKKLVTACEVTAI